MSLPSLRAVLPSPTATVGVSTEHDGVFATKMGESSADEVLTLDNYSFVCPPRVVSSFTTLVGKKKLEVGATRGRIILPYPPFETLRSPSKERTRAIDSSAQYYVVMVKMAKLQEVALEVYEKHVTPFRIEPRGFPDQLAPLLDGMLREGNQYGPERESVLESLGTLILVELLRSCLDRQVACPARYPGIKRVLRVIHANFESDLTVVELAEIAGLSRFHFIAVFRDITDYTPHAYVRAVRLRAAARLLREGWDVTATCFKVGFKSLSGFEDAFLSFHGVLPRKYRASHKA